MTPNSNTEKDAIEALVEAGHAYFDHDGSLVGIASDGTHVSLQFRDRKTTLAYLAACPTPEDW